MCRGSEVLGALTTRGRSFLAVGGAVIGCAFLLGEHHLLSVGVLALVLPLAALALVRRSRLRLSCAREIRPVRAPAGSEARVRLRLSNDDWIPTGLLMVSDTLPPGLGEPPRFLVGRLARHGTAEFGYRLRAYARGRYQVGPLTVRIADPFGLAELDQPVPRTTSLLVTPALTPLPDGLLHGQGVGEGRTGARMIAHVGEDDVAPREYRDGDDIRRVHWRSTARHGELMVRREEHERTDRAAVLLDTRAHAHTTRGPGSSFERAVSAAASVAAHLMRGGFGLRFLTAQQELPTAAHGEEALLSALAIIQPTLTVSLAHGARMLRGEETGLVVAVLGALTVAEATVLAGGAQGRGARVAVLVTDPLRRSTGPGQLADDDAVDRVLRGAGWRPLWLGPRDPLDQAWRTLLPAGGRTR
ncbi:DUF58 domain-containing protein [Allonocardiopsis opalescens]|uniref:Uncharacterized protein (DUF58 family) n=1 Tax=Allonocardiopsis opalescens TaxID=1144618 RepID=A0A2T0Q3V6_9ACTN|nr:DUF58 domain-containing protein [Allonocardiopsis opalescens]PRX98477.1 uncharacterized protein (DUF58 family) [Allonocardiopsis opalescens]